MALSRFGFGPRYIQLIQLLYTTSKARGQVNGYISDPFSLHQGTRQGCPLPPLLFALALELLAAAVRESPDIIGFQRPTGEDKIALYADDSFLFWGDTSSLDAAMSLIDT